VEPSAATVVPVLHLAAIAAFEPAAALERVQGALA